MNIFAIDSDPIIAAKFYCDKHVISQIKEISQILSTAHRVLDGNKCIGLSPGGNKQIQFTHPENKLYKATHINHPSGVWVRSGVEQYNWAKTHLNALCKEYTYRYGKIHKTELDGLVEFLCNNVPKNIKNNKFTLPTPAMPDYCIIPGDVVSSYRKYYILEKRNIATWSGKINSRPIPTWFLNKDNNEQS